MTKANHWLQKNPTYRVINCETVLQYWAHSHGYNPYRVVATRSKVSTDNTIGMHVLRYKIRDLATKAKYFVAAVAIAVTHQDISGEGG